MSDPFQQVQELLLASYAARGRFPRPRDITQADIEKVDRLASKVAHHLTVLLTAARRKEEGLEQTIRRLDQQVDIYEDVGLLVSPI